MPSFGSTLSTSTRLKMSAQVSSSGDPDAGRLHRCRRAVAVGASAGVDRRRADRCRRNCSNASATRQPLGRGERIGLAVAERNSSRPAAARGRRQQRRAVLHQGLVGLVGAIPFEHGELGMMQRPALAVAEDAGEGRRSASRRPPAASCRRIPARCADRAGAAPRLGADQARSRRHAGASRCRARAAGSRSRPRRSPARRTSAAAPPDPPARRAGTAAGRRGRREPTRGGGRSWQRVLPVESGQREKLAFGVKISMVRADNSPARGCACSVTQGTSCVKVIASSLRKGNVLEIDGKLYVVLTAENFHPGKGTPTTQIDMRRISDGVKTTAALQDHRAGRARPRRGSRAPASSIRTATAFTS